MQMIQLIPIILTAFGTLIRGTWVEYVVPVPVLAASWLLAESLSRRERPAGPPSGPVGVTTGVPADALMDVQPNAREGGGRCGDDVAAPDGRVHDQCQ